MATRAGAPRGLAGRALTAFAFAASAIACQAVSGLDELHGKTAGSGATTTDGATTTTTDAGTTTGTGVGGAGGGGTTTTTTTTTTGAGGGPPGCNQPDPGTCTQGAGQCALQCSGSTCTGVCSQPAHPGGCDDLKGNVSCGAVDTLSAACSLDCADAWCAGKHVICGKNHPCTVHCGAGACLGSTIECPQSQQPCTITCEAGGCDATTKVQRGGGTLTATCLGGATLALEGPPSKCPAAVESCQ